MPNTDAQNCIEAATEAAAAQNQKAKTDTLQGVQDSAAIAQQEQVAMRTSDQQTTVASAAGVAASSTPLMNDAKTVAHDVERELHPMTRNFLGKVEAELAEWGAYLSEEVAHIMAILKKNL